MVKNRSELLSHGFIKGREKALDIAENALQQVDPFAAVKRYLNLDGNMLRVNQAVFNLNKVNNIYAIGAGKATYPLAVALEEILGDRISDGFIAVKKGQKNPFSDILQISDFSFFHAPRKADSTRSGAISQNNLTHIIVII